MRQRFEVQYELGTTPIEKVSIPSKSRDQMPPILKSLQHIFITAELNEKNIFYPGRESDFPCE